MGDIKAILRPNYTDKKGLAPILIYVSVKRQKVYFKTGLKVDPEKWNPAEEKIPGPGQKDSNLVINKCKARIVDIFTKYRLQNREKELTAELLRKEYATPSLQIDLHAYLLKTIEKRGDIGNTTKISHKAVASKLKQFREKISFAEFTPALIEEFRYYMKNTSGNGKNTIHKAFKILRTYMNIALRDKVIFENPFDKIKATQVKPEQIFLMPDELNKLIGLYKTKKLPINLKMILRAFLFSCFTGLRISDLRRITKNNIIGDYLVITPYKTKEIKNEPVRIPLSIGAIELINDSMPAINGQLFFFFADQTANEKIKKIAQMDNVKINPKVSFKSGRHTFATMYLRQGGRLDILQKLLGHSKITDTMKYTHVLTEDIEKEMKVMDKLWRIKKPRKVRG